MVGTLAAARTKRLRIGTAVSLAPFYHPLRLAEEVALLDLLSGGAGQLGRRARLCPGRVHRLRRAARGERHERFRETVEIVLQAWTDEQLNFAGQHFHFDDIEVLPKPAAAAASAGVDGGDARRGRSTGRPAAASRS